MANDHYAVCEATRHYFCLGEFYEGDVDSRAAILQRLSNPDHLARLTCGAGVAAMLSLCAFMRRRRPHPVRVVHENEFHDLKGLAEPGVWVEDTLDEVPAPVALRQHLVASSPLDPWTSGDVAAQERAGEADGRRHCLEGWCVDNTAADTPYMRGYLRGWRAAEAEGLHGSQRTSKP